MGKRPVKPVKPLVLGFLFAAVLLAVLLSGSCALFSPTPDNDQIAQAVRVSNQAQEEPLELIYEEMQVPHRYPGRASAVIWVADKSLQRNYMIAYDRRARAFYVKGFITLRLGEDGVYRGTN